MIYSISHLRFIIQFVKLHNNGAIKKTSIKDLADQMKISRQMLSAIIYDFHSDGLLDTIKMPFDKRSKYIEVNDKFWDSLWNELDPLLKKFIEQRQLRKETRAGN